MKWQNHLMSVLIFALTMSCSSLESSLKVSSNTLAKTESSELVQIAPNIPFNTDEAFFPLRQREDGKILASYQWRECTKRFVVCVKWEKKRVYFEDLSWFLSNGFGLTKQRKP
jgi:hypothetical protein